MASPWLQGAMSRAKTTGEPKLSAVAQIPTMDSLAERIRAASNELVSAQAEHDRIEIAKQNEMREFDDALSASRQTQALIEEKLKELRDKLADHVRALGIRAEVP